MNAWAYTEDAEAGRIYFHKLEDKSDREYFCKLSRIDAVDSPEESTPPSLNELLQSSEGRRLLGLPEEQKDNQDT